jgi:hypothetical protein
MAGLDPAIHVAEMTMMGLLLFYSRQAAQQREAFFGDGSRQILGIHVAAEATCLAGPE